MATLIIPRISRQEFIKYQRSSSCFLPYKIQGRGLTQGRNFHIFTKSPIYKTSNLSIRFASTISPPPKDLDPIPEPPAPVPEAEWTAIDTPASLQNVLTANGEPTFESLGLGGWTPVGLVQNCLEFLHISCDLPWWTSIMIGTICVRVLLFPLVILTQKNAAKLNNNLPQLQMLQLKMTEARQSGNKLEAAQYAQEMMVFLKEKGCNPLKNMMVPLAQAPIFISFFIGLRKMANCPVESLSTGGLWWFTDLTVPDQYFILPLITSATLWCTIELGADTGRLTASNMMYMKYVFRAIPVVIFPFTMNFPGAILCYWVSTNFISLIQVGILKIPAVRKFFKIEQLVVHKAETLPMKSKGFVKGMKESFTNIKISQELNDRQRWDEMQFQRAGRGPLQKTFKFDPTKVKIKPDVVAKNKD